MIHDGRMNALYTAIRFLEPMKRGVNRPMRIQGESQEDGKRTDIVLKCRAGYADAPECLLREHVAYQLARRLGITTPEPVWVYVPEGLAWSAAEYETHRELLERSVGWNFGTIHLGNEWKPWISRDCAKKFRAHPWKMLMSSMPWCKMRIGTTTTRISYGREISSWFWISIKHTPTCVGMEKKIDPGVVFCP